MEDQSAITALKDSKAVSEDIKEKQQIADKTEEEIDAVREGYVPIGSCQILYFVASLANIEPTYQYSLEWYRLICECN